MEPKTGVFRDQKQYETEFAEEIESGALPLTMPKEWPRFAVGDKFSLRGYPFEIVRINRSSLVLRPTGRLSARKVIRRMTK